MKLKAPFRVETHIRSVGFVLALAMLSAGLSACSKREPEIPAPRPIIIRSGARLFSEPDRMQTIDAWFRSQQDNIRDDPSFLIESVPGTHPPILGSRWFW